MTTKKKLQVFVSSTYTDLIDERQAAVEAILKAGHIPAGMELFSAGSESQLETIRRWIDESDVYMLILGGRYGSIDPKTALSYTELEYDYAVSAGKPMFAVVIAEDALDAKVKIKGKSALETSNPKELNLFREKVLTRISSFFSDGKDIKLAVHETLADLQARCKFMGWVSGSEVQDTTPLLEEIALLRKQRDEAVAQLAEVRTRAEKNAAKPSSRSRDAEFNEILETLQGIEITSKVFGTDGKPGSRSVLRILNGWRDALITGVTNQMGAGDKASLLFYNVCPKLEMYELAALEKVAGVAWQRYRLTPKGKALLVHFDKSVKAAKSKDVPSEAGSPSAAAKATAGAVKGPTAASAKKRSPKSPT